MLSSTARPPVQGVPCDTPSPTGRYPRPAVDASQVERAVVDAVPAQLVVGGRRAEAADGARFAVHDPSTDAVLCEVADAGPADAAAALDAAVVAQPAWARHPPRERGEILRRAWGLVMDRIDDLALLITLEMGKPLAESRAEVAYGAEFLRWFSEEAVRVDGGYTVATNGQGRLLTYH